MLVATLLYASAASGAHRILVPIYSPFGIVGAYGSVWLTELSILNTTTERAVISNYYPWCGPVTCIPVEFPPGVQTSHGYITSAWNKPAAVLFIDDQFANHFAFQLRVRDTSRVAEGYGTWFPVVDEADFRRAVLHLLDIPIAPRYRHMLRVYSMDAPGESTVRVRIHATSAVPTAGPDPIIAEKVLALSSLFPHYAELADLAALAGEQPPERFRVSIEPEGDFHIWGMVSVTNNDTQQVTAIFPASH